MGLRFLITGGLGHIGSKLIREYAKREDIELIRVMDNLSTQRYPSLFDLPKTHVRFEFIEGDINDSDKVAESVKGIDVVLHFAAITDAREAMKIPEETEKINFIGTKIVLEAAINAGVKKFLFPSTTSVYGDAEGEVDENYENCHPEGPYAINKLRAEQLVLSSNGKNGIQTFVLRKGTIFGTSIGMRFHTAINKFAWLAALDKPLTVWDTAIDQKRPYLSLNDAIRAYEFVEKKGKSGELYNVLNKNYTVREVVETIKKIKKDVQVEIVKSPMSVATSFDVSDRKIRNLGFEIKDNLESCIKETLNLFDSIKNNSSEEVSQIAELLKTKSISELETFLKILSEKIYEFRKENNSMVPMDIFPHVMAIGGISSVVELLLECYDNGKLVGYAMKKREANESGWQNLYHIPGTVVRLNDSPEKIFSRLENEMSNSKTNYLMPPSYFGTEIHNELRRKVVRTSALYIAKINADEIKRFFGEWKIFNGHESEILDHHKEVIKWVTGVYKGDFISLPPSF